MGTLGLTSQGMYAWPPSTSWPVHLSSVDPLEWEEGPKGLSSRPKTLLLSLDPLSPRLLESCSEPSFLLGNLGMVWSSSPTCASS